MYFKMKLTNILRYLLCDPQESGKYQIFSGNEENFIENGATLLEERISLFNGRTNSIYCFSVDDLNSMIVDKDQITGGSAYYEYKSFRGVWDGKLVQVKSFGGERSNEFACREIAVATEMATHRNVHRLLGCCLHTKSPILVYEWEENGTLKNRIINDESKGTLEWKDRLRIAWEIAHAVAYLHTAFDRPIVHRGLKPENVYLDKDDSVRLSDFSLCISIPAGQKHVEATILGTWAYAAPDYVISGRVAESSDVYSFGTILLVLLTGKSPSTIYHSNQGRVSLSEWVGEFHAVNCLGDVVVPTITRNGLIADEVHLKAIVELALSCSNKDEECRPTMVDVATRLKDIIISASDSL